MDFISSAPGVVLITVAMIGYQIYKSKSIKANTKWENKAQDLKQSLEERNKDIIQRHFDNIAIPETTNGQISLLETSVSDCLEDIAEAEQDPLMKSSNTRGLIYAGDGVSQGISKQWINLKDSLTEQFKVRIQSINDTERKAYEKITEGKVEALKQKYSTLISQFFDVADKTISLVDAYGDENLTPLTNEVDIIINKIIDKEGRQTMESQWYLVEGNLTTVPDQYRTLHEYLIQTFKDKHTSKV